MGDRRDYDALYAAHLLRSPDFAASYAGMFLATDGGFFQDFFLRDVVLHGLSYFKDTGKLLPPAALKVDASQFGREGASLDNYSSVIDEVWRIPTSSLVSSKEHVSRNLVQETQIRLLQRSNLEELFAPGRLDELWTILEEIRSVEATRNGGAKRLSQGLLEALREPPLGTPIGLPEVEGCLPGKGVCPGETLLYFGYTGIGKSMMAYHSVRASAAAGRQVLLWSFGDVGEKLAMLRLAQGYLQWPEDKLRTYPDEAYRMFMERFGDLPLYVRYSPAHTITKAEMKVQLDRIEQETGQGTDLLVVDYSEKRAAGRDWDSVCGAYEETRQVCQERGIAGIDIAQENVHGQMSYFNLRKDGDIVVQLTVTEPSEWRKKRRSDKSSDAEEPSIPTRGPVWGEVVKTRGGITGKVFELWMDRSLGTVQPRRLGGEV